MKRIRKYLDKFQNIKEISEKEDISLPFAYKSVEEKIDGLKDEDILKNKKGRKELQFSDTIRNNLIT